MLLSELTYYKGVLASNISTYLRNKLYALHYSIDLNSIKKKHRIINAIEIQIPESFM